MACPSRHPQDGHGRMTHIQTDGCINLRGVLGYQGYVLGQKRLQRSCDPVPRLATLLPIHGSRTVSIPPPRFLAHQRNHATRYGAAMPCQWWNGRILQQGPIVAAVITTCHAVRAAIDANLANRARVATSVARMGQVTLSNARHRRAGRSPGDGCCRA
jgi:hypothetical protein